MSKAIIELSEGDHTSLFLIDINEDLIAKLEESGNVDIIQARVKITATIEDLGNFPVNSGNWIDPNAPETPNLFKFIEASQPPDGSTIFRISDIEILETPTPGRRREQIPGTAPSQPIPRHESFEQDFSKADYKETPKGKSLFVQIDVKKAGILNFKRILSFIQVKRLDKTNINIEQQEINVENLDNFSIIYDVDDLNQPTGVIFVQHFLKDLEGNALSDLIEVRLVIDQPSPIPTPVKDDQFFSKVIGIFTTLTAASIMSSKRS